MNQTLRKLCLGGAGLALVLLVVGLVTANRALWQPAAVACAAGLAIGFGAVPWLRTYQFTAWIVCAVTAAMLYPNAFLKWGEFDLRNRWLITLVVQAVMFGMGTQMKLRDFAGVAQMPWAVFVGVLGQFTIMPLVGYGLTRVFRFEPEIAAGIILIGSCSAGLASNVMAWLARANLALSVTLTSLTTLLAPVMTPLWMKLLAGQLVEVRFFNMMMEIIKIVLVPVGAALLADHLKSAPAQNRRATEAIAIAGAAWLAFVVAGGRGLILPTGLGPAGAIFELVNLLLGAVLAGAAYHRLAKLWSRLPQLMPLVSMAGIVYFTTVTTAAGRDNLLKVGALLFCAAIIHNLAGYMLGYSLSRACGLDINSARAVAFEVGMQNGGMASGIAGALGKLGTMGLAAAIFSPWMNVSGSLLANYWRRNQAKPHTSSDAKAP
ncbi:MAG: bile acid:sodium symporter family protein [Verrucomicrobiae bacterium]|nr:bile acid:sodium symporter family protein [Verrucomicrobiae bacterium]